MARKKGDYTTRRQEPEGRGRIWRAIRVVKRFTLEDLELISEQGYQNCHRYVQSLWQGGYLRRVGRAEDLQFVYQLLRNSGPEPPIPQGRGKQIFDPNQQKIYPCQSRRVDARLLAWQAMRALPQFTQAELAKQAVCAESNSQKYIRALLVAGYLEVVRPARTRQPAIYRLIRDTGDLAPVVQRDGTLVDPNLTIDGDECDE